MANKKEQKTGLFRRLFGMDEAERTNENPRRPVTTGQDSFAAENSIVADGDRAQISSVAAQNEKLHSPGETGDQSDVLPWERPTLQQTNLQSGAGQANAGLKKEPTWEEILNKIIPPAAEQGQAVKTGAPDQGEPIKGSEPEELLKQADLGQSAAQETLLSFGSDMTDYEAGQSAEIGQAVDLTLDELWDTAVQQSQSVAQPEGENGITAEALPQEDPKVADAPAVVQGRLSTAGVLPKTMQNGHAVWLLDLAKEAAAGAELDKAIRLLEIAYILEPHPEVLLARARVETDLGNLTAAANSVLQALTDFPDSEDGIELLSFLAELGAEVDFERVGALTPETAPGSVRLARLCLAHDRLAAALDFFNAATDSGFNVDEIQTELGQLNRRIGNTGEAIRHYQRALELQSDLDSAASLFELYLETGSYAEAEVLANTNLKGYRDTVFRQSLARLEFLYGQSLFERHDLEPALDKFYASLEYGGQEAKEWVIRTLRLLADQSPDPAKVQEYLEAALDMGGFEQELAQRLSQSYLQTGNDAKALHLLQSLYEADPTDAKVAANLAATLQKLGELDQAAELLESLAVKGLLGYESREQLYNYYRNKGRFKEARRHLEAIHSQDSEEFRVDLQSLVWEEIRFRVERGELEQAWEICRQELGNQPTPEMLGMAMKILSERVDDLIAKNQAALALRELEQGRALGLNILDLGLKEAALYESMGNDRAALKVYESIAAKAPEVWDKVKELYLKAATREYLAGNLTESRQLLEDARTKLPENVEIRRALGVLYQETGQFALAAALVQDSMEETEIQVSTDHLNILRPHNYRRVRLG